MPDGGVCADITLAGGDLYVTDTLLGRILRLTTPDPSSAEDGRLTVWSADRKLAGRPRLSRINGIAFDGAGRSTQPTTARATCPPSGSRTVARRAGRPDPPPHTDHDSRRHPVARRYLYVADNGHGVVRVDPRKGKTTVIDESPDQPTSLVFVDDDIWITEGQVLHLQINDPTCLPFKVVRRRL